METIVKKLYEAMFLIDSAAAASDWDGAIGAIETILKRAEAEVISMKKWDERRLAYSIKKKHRGTYILCYFKADGQKISAIERDAQLSERVMRVLILSAEAMSQEDIGKLTPAEQAESRRQQALDESAERARSAQAAKQKAEEQKAAEASEKTGDNEKEAEAVMESSKAEEPSALESKEENEPAEKQDE